MPATEVPLLRSALLRVLDLASLLPLWRSRRLLVGMLARELRRSYIGSAAGWFWLVFRPLVTAAAYFFVFDTIFAVRFDRHLIGTENYAVYLLSGLLPWLAFVDGVVQGGQSLVRNGGLIKKTRFPLELIPAEVVLGGAVRNLPFVLLLALGHAAMGFASWLGLLYLLPWMVLQMALTYYLGLVAAVLTAALRDIGHLLQSSFGLLIFLAPILYPLQRVPAEFSALLWINPATPLVKGYHTIVLQGQFPDPVDIAVLGAWLVSGMLAARVLLRRSGEQLADWL
jgi:ABC-type polysaccharide/polyol phosphate export permease